MATEIKLQCSFKISVSSINNVMDKDIIVKIKSMRDKGFSYSSIGKFLLIPMTTVRYHCNKDYKEKAKGWSRKYREKEPLQPKISDYYREAPEDCDFVLKDVKEKFKDNWHCYLTGTPIDYNEVDKYCLDHIVPKCSGGKSNLENMGLLRRDVNAAKSAKTINEFLLLCKEVLEYNGYKVSS